MSTTRLLLVFAATLLVVSGASAQWVTFVDETATRLVADPALGADDVEEKDYIWGDVDNDNDIDLVVVRKEPFTSIGKEPNVLFMNENGVLVDRTDLYATKADVGGDSGFLTATNDRDVQLVDVNDDGWLDLVTAVTISDGDPKHIGHPRIYINLGENGLGDWLGFRFEDSRIPTMLSYTGQAGFNPRFCSVSFGDVDGDDMPDLYFGDYDNGEVGPPMPAGADYNDRLLLNDGTGNFTDLTQAQFLGLMTVPGFPTQRFEVSNFGAANAILDMNADGFADIVKQTSLQNPLMVAVAYNDPLNEGFYDDYEVINQNSPYFISAGDLNQDGLPDIVVTDDGADRYMLHQGIGADDRADFISFTFSYDQASDDGFGGNSIIADLDNDTWPDVMIADVDVDTFGCGRRMHIYRNLGGSPGDNIVLEEQTSGTSCQGGNPSCIVASIPADKLVGVHDVAVFDIDGDGWKDLVVGRCTGTEVYMNQPPIGLTITYPGGLPSVVPPDQPYVFQVKISPFGATSVVPGTESVFTSLGGGPFSPTLLTPLGGDLYEATLPAASCPSSVAFYISAEASGVGTFLDPPAAPVDANRTTAALGTIVAFEDRMEGDVSGWTITSDASLTAGEWESADPNGTLSGAELASPEDDSEDGAGNVKAFITQNGAPGGAAGAADVDGGPTDLISPPIDLAGSDAIISYYRWMFSSGDDVLEVSVSDDGSVWQVVETLDGGNNSWQQASFLVSEHLTPSANVQVRFRTGDNPNNNVSEAGVDFFTVNEFSCSVGGASGEVPDGSAGTPLTVNLETNGDVTLDWGVSCAVGDSDYAVYEGTVGDFTSHVQKTCSTSGATTATFAQPAGDVYFLVVPNDGVNEGGYGTTTGGQRPAATAACLPQSFGNCQ